MAKTDSKGIESCVARRNQAGQWPIYILFVFSKDNKKTKEYDVYKKKRIGCHDGGGKP